MRALLIVLSLLCVQVAFAETATSPDSSPPAPATAASNPFSSLKRLAQNATLLGDLGAYQRKVSTKSSDAQQYFNQGLALLFGFNHDEAARSFARAGQIDSSCAMCWWGVAFALGPNYNIPMLPERARAAWDALHKAKRLSAKAPAVEKALIGALMKRYKGPAYLDPVAMQPYNEAFAAAMRDVAKEYPDDLDVQAFFAESLMNLNPWKLWSNQGEPAAGTEEIVKTLETILAANADHPGANHYYIHAIEASKNPGKAEAAADRLAALMPGAGHTVHMPAHIYQRVGRYADASEANRRAIIADENYIKKSPPIGYYPFYLAHNHGFLAYSATMEGRSAEAFSASQKSADTMPRGVVCGMPGMDFFLAEPLLVMVRFGKWSDILKAPKPDEKYQVLSGLWHHAQGMALASTGKIAEAKSEVEVIRKIKSELPPGLIAGLNQGGAILDLGAIAVEARIAEMQKSSESITLWKKAVELEDGMSYHEPADWFYPTRHYLGAALLDAGRTKEAEAVYRQDLQNNPKNGWSYFGLWKSLKAQKRKKEASAIQVQFKQSWAGADIELTRSAF